MIRRASHIDAPAIAHVHIASWRTTYPGIVAQDHIDSLSEQAFVERWYARLKPADRNSILVSLADDGNVNGFIHGGPTREPELPFDAELYAIYMIEEAQGHGVGRALVHALASDLHSFGFNSLCVTVLADNPACRFYERMGGQFVRNEPHTVGGREYVAARYGWPDLNALRR